MNSISPESVNGTKTPILQIEGLEVEFQTSRGIVHAVQDVNFDIFSGEMVAIVGESGSGKSVSALAIMGLLPKESSIVRAKTINFGGRNLLQLTEKQMQKIRGHEIGMIFQEPMTSLNPVLTIGDQLTEPLKIHLGMSNESASLRAIELLQLVGISDAERRLRQYPHEFSGGMRQRVMIAIGLSCKPKLLIADEPTTALDVTIQAQILELMKNLCRDLGVAMIIITHNLGVVARYANRVNVMYAANIVEQANAATIFNKPSHPYTAGLIRAVPRLDQGRESRLATIDGQLPDLTEPPAGCRFAPRCPIRVEKCTSQPPLAEVGPDQKSACFRASEMNSDLRAKLYSDEDENSDRSKPTNPATTNSDNVVLEVNNLQMNFYLKVNRNPFSKKYSTIRAVNNVSFSINYGQTLGLVGESGCGKTTVGRSILRLLDPTSGEIYFENEEISKLSQSDLNPIRRKIQVIFQDPFASLNPRMTIGQIISEPLTVFKRVSNRKSALQRVHQLLDDVGIPIHMIERYPHQLSGGQRQRVGIARALALEPTTIICDEPVSALDVSVQAQIINLLEELQVRYGLTYVFIAHDLAVVRHISHTVAVMYLGRIMEIAECETLFANPLHPYTKALMDAVPTPDVEIERLRNFSKLEGEIPSPLTPIHGCVFSSRCPIATSECHAQAPELKEVGEGHYTACLKIDGATK